jgi:4-hydroxy-tetrahydrodipicolinate synthase
MANLHGIFVPFCTTFDASGDAIDEGALGAHIDRLVAAGVHGLVSTGGTGEFAFLTEAERRRIHAFAAKRASKLPLIAGCSAISTRDTIENAKAAEGAGAAALMILPPYFEGPTMDGVMWHYERVARAVTVPIVVYNIPANTNRDVTPDLFSKLLKVDNIQYIKDSTGDFTRTQQLIATGGKILNGGDTLAFPALVAGAAGCIWGGANVTPAACVALYDLVKAGELVEAAALWQRLTPAQIFYWTHDYNSSIKAAVNLLGGNVGICRKPALPLGEADLADLRAALQPMMA